jgi:hypothetical protein
MPRLRRRRAWGASLAATSSSMDLVRVRLMRWPQALRLCCYLFL